MERRRFVLRVLEALAIGGFFLLAGCGKEEKRPAFGNQGRLWDLASGQEKIEEPVELVYSKETPALFRDASMGKADPSFVPRVGGG